MTVPFLMTLGFGFLASYLVWKIASKRMGYAGAIPAVLEFIILPISVVFGFMDSMIFPEQGSDGINFVWMIVVLFNVFLVVFGLFVVPKMAGVPTEENKMGRAFGVLMGITALTVLLVFLVALALGVRFA